MGELPTLEAADLQERDLQQPPEKTNTNPEIIANSPLENTTLVYNVPVMAEWQNGNLLRMLRGMFSQRVEPDQAMEVMLMINSGANNLETLFAYDENQRQFTQDESGNYSIIQKASNEQQQKSLNIVQQNRDAADFLRKVVEVQKLARLENGQKSDSSTQTENLISQTEDPLQRHVLELARDKANEVSISAVDGTLTLFSETAYRGQNLAPYRTMGTDFAMARFGEKADEVVFGLFDADTLPEHNRASMWIQSAFRNHPDLRYFFIGMSELPPGHFRKLIGSGPNSNISRTELYSSGIYGIHGSPQIYFRLNAYPRLQELAAWNEHGYTDSVDFDTTKRLIYLYGDLQQGLMHELCAEADFFPPTALTADRLDGSWDSSARVEKFTKQTSEEYLTQSVPEILQFHRELTEQISQLPPAERATAELLLERAYTHFEKRQKVQQRFNRIAVQSMLGAYEAGELSIDNGLKIDQTAILARPNGEAILHYINANQALIAEVIQSPRDLEVISYLIGQQDSLPPDVTELSPFLAAIREYVGNVPNVDRLHDNSMVEITPAGRNNHKDLYQTRDLRVLDSRDSLMASMIVEILASGYTHRMLFESSKDNPKGIFNWPENPDEQKVEYHFGNQADRVEVLKMRLKEMGVDKPIAKSSEEGISKLRLKAFPLLTLARKLLHL